MATKLLAIAILLWVGSGAKAQHEHHNIPTQKDSAQKNAKPATDNTQNNDSANHGKSSHQMEVPMSHAFSLNLPMTRNGSGTAWLPDASPMYGSMFHNRKWMFMAHGSIFVRYNNQDFTDKGKRGDSRFDAPTWFMFMGQRKVGSKGLFHFSSMLSLDPMIEGGKGYPLLFQTGETYKGQPLVDRQHPHDLFSELAVSYAYAFSKNVDAFVYLGYPGEPALGPVTFMHRPSSLDNPNSPISHHWVDATHITFGVATIGIRAGRFKLEGSSFTGREPDENRYNFDKPRFDSWSARLSYNPSPNWSLQVSHGYVKSPEAIHAEENVNKTTASAIYSVQTSNRNRINITALWGMNKANNHESENAVLLEASWRIRKAAVYTRYEFTEKSGGELLLEPTFEDHDIFGVHAFSLGYNYDLFEIKKIRLAIGGQWSIYGASAKLNTIYGKNPMAVQAYLRVYPSLMNNMQR